MKKRLLTRTKPSSGIVMWKYVMMTMLISFISISELLAQPPTFAGLECACLENATQPGNGQFGESLIIESDPGETWIIVSAEGFYDFNSEDPPMAPVLYPYGTLIPEGIPGNYRIQGKRIENTFYSIMVSNGTDTYTYNSSSKVCTYPDATILGDKGICVDDVSSSLYSVDIDMDRILPDGSIEWTIPAGGNILAGQGTNQILVEWGDVVGEYEISVEGEAAAYMDQETGLCSFESTSVVFISDEISPTLACNNSVNISINNSCVLEVIPSMILQDMELNNDSYELVITDTETNTVIEDNVIDMSYIGVELQVAVIHECSSNSCWGYITVEDGSIPSLDCGDDVTVECHDDISPESVGFPLPDMATVTPIPDQSNAYTVTGFDGCSDVTLVYSEVIESNLCEGDFGSTIVRNWVATDNSGNSSSCQQSIFIMRGDISDIVFPPNYDDAQGDEPSLDACENFPRLEDGHPDPSYTGSPIGALCANVKISFEDTELPGGCELAFKILRRWEITNQCDTELPLVHVQTITVMDNTPPVVAAVPEFEAYTSELSCSASIDLPGPIVISECSEWDYTVAYKLRDDSDDRFTNALTDGIISNSDGTYTISEVSGDSVWIVYYVTDDCGNMATASTEVAIIDHEQPVPVCNLNTFVGLTDEGTAYAGVSTFDDGSWDPCGIEKIEVRRMENSACGVTSVFGDEVKFCCEDVGDTVRVRLKVTDLSGNENECMVLVVVQDNRAPEFTYCPSNVTVDCESNLTDYSIFGTPIATDNCDVRVTELDPIENFSDCGRGQIIRRFIASDDAGNEVSCQQTITVESLNPFNGNNINWPKNYTTNNGCAGSGIAPEMLPIANAYPRFNADPCAQIAVDYEDVVFQWVDGYCFKVLRYWTVFDECQFDPNVVGSGEFTHTQIIAVRNSVAPSFILGCNGENQIITQLDNCLSRIQLSVIAEDDCEEQDLAYSYDIDLDNDGTVDITGLGNSLDRNVDYGSHKVTFYVTDECDNTESCEQIINVEDQKAPTPYCLGEVVTTLNEEGIAEIWASDFDNGSFDNCIGNDDVVVAFNAAGTQLSRTYNCDSLTSAITELEVMIFAVDQYGNSDFCTSILKLQDNYGVCGFESENRVAVSGKITTENQDDLSEVEVMIMDMATETPTYDMTDEIGAYAFSDMKMYTDYYVEPNRTTSYVEGVSTLDLVLIQRHILGISELDSPYKIIAADINASATVTATDIVQLRKLILGIYDELPSNTSWRFVDAGFEFYDAQDPFPFDEKINLDQLDQDMLAANFIGVKVGDVNGSYEANAIKNTAADTRSAFNVRSFDESIEAGQAFAVPLEVSSEVSLYGMQMTIEFDAEKVSYTGYSSNINLTDANFGLSLAHRGQISISYNAAEAISLSANDLLVELSFVAIEDTKVSDIISMSERALSPEIYVADKGQISTQNINLEIENRNGIVHESRFQLMQNVPNPFSNNTTISFVLPSAGQASLKVFDYTGRLLIEYQDEFQKGYNQIELNINDIEAQGILYYQLDTKTHSASKKMIVIK